MGITALRRYHNQPSPQVEKEAEVVKVPEAPKRPEPAQPAHFQKRDQPRKNGK